MEFILLFLIILINAISITAILKNKIEVNIPIAVIGIILIEYIFGLFDKLLLGVRIIEILTLISTVYMLYAILKKRIKIKEQIITPGLVIYIIICLAIIIVNKNMLFKEYDEFSHWGIIVKHMFEFRKFWSKCRICITI